MSELDHFIIKEIVVQQFDIKANTEKAFKIIPSDAKDKPGAQVFGKITFKINPEGGALLFPSDDGSVLIVQHIAPMDLQTISAMGDATATPGEKVVTTQFQIRTLAATLDHFDIVEGSETPV